MKAVETVAVEKTLPTTKTTTSQDATKDAGRVHIGGGFLSFDSTKDSGRVHIGGGFLRF